MALVTNPVAKPDLKVGMLILYKHCNGLIAVGKIEQDIDRKQVIYNNGTKYLIEEMNSTHEITDIPTDGWY